MVKAEEERVNIERNYRDVVPQDRPNIYKEEARPYERQQRSQRLQIERQQYKPRGECWYCSGLDHFVMDCPQKKKC